MSNETKCNPVLIRERAKCTFDVDELKHIFYGSEKATKERRHFEDAVFAVKELKDVIPEEYLSHKDRYENAVRKATILRDVFRDYKATHKKDPPRSYVTSAVIKDVSPFLLHNSMFVPTIVGQGTPEQQAEWLPKAENMQVIGTYAQTELGHGSFIRGLETIATYDPKTEEFILNNPTLSSFKWWPGGLGSTVNHCVVVAQLYINGKSHGIHPFIVQIRDLETHKPLPGVKVGEIGPKMGFQTANNGFLGFDNFRIPRKNMLMKNAQVLKDGTFVKGVNEKLTYGTMVLVRVIIVGDSSFYAAAAATIAVRYAAVRHQSHIKASEPEAQILDYLTQQHKLFIAIASSHVYRNAFLWMEKMYRKVMQELSQDNQDNLPELHASACCLKAVCSRDASVLVEECRLACGGHGFMTSSSLPLTYGLVVASVTYEGERTVLLLQTARYLMKAWMAALKGKVLSPSVSYLLHSLKENNGQWQNTPEGIVKGFQHVSVGKVKAAYETIQKYVKAGKDYEDAWNLASVRLVKASEAHSRAILCKLSWEAVSSGGDSEASPSLLRVLQQLAQLYLTYWTLETSGDLLVYSNITKDDLIILRDRYEELLVAIRPNAVGLVDGFDLRDEILNSTLGSYDGRVYERLMEEALKSPLNQEPVNQSFHKYIKPMMEKSKL